VKIGPNEYQAALRDAMMMMPRADAEADEVMMAASAADIDVVAVMDAFKDGAFMEVVQLMPLFVALIESPSDHTLGEVCEWIAGRKLVVLAAGVRAGRLWPETPFDDAVKEML
jgi:hypothetical protein